MEKNLFSPNELGRIRKANMTRLKSLLGVEVEMGRDFVSIKSLKNDSFDEYIAMRIIEAVGFGFDMDRALLLRDAVHVLRKIDLKSDKRTSATLGRLIGTRGRTKSALEFKSGCEIVINDHEVGILGKANDVEVAAKAIKAIIRGAPQGKAVSGLEKDKARLRRADEDAEEYVEK